MKSKQAIHLVIGRAEPKSFRMQACGRCWVRQIGSPALEWEAVLRGSPSALHVRSTKKAKLFANQPELVDESVRSKVYDVHDCYLRIYVDTGW